MPPTRFTRKHRRHAARDAHGAPLALELLPPPAAGERPRAVVLALLYAGLFHLLLWQAVPERFAPAIAVSVTPVELAKVSMQNPEEKNEEIPDELLPPEMRRTPPPPPPKPRFVEVNPVAPSNNPPDTINEGAATQRAAQPEPDKTRSDTPKVDGEEPDSSRIVNNIPRDLLPPRMQPESGRPLGAPSTDPAPVVKPQASKPAEPVPEKSEPAKNPATPETPEKKPAPEKPVIPVKSPTPAKSPPKISEKKTVKVADAKKTPKALDGPNPAQARPNLAPKNDGGIAVSPAPGDAPSTPKIAENKGEKISENPNDKKQAGEKTGDAAEAQSPPPPAPAPATPAGAKVEIVAAGTPTETRAPQQMPRGDPDGTPVPKPRPQAARVGSTGVRMRNPSGTNEAGVLALDAKYSEFGDYTQRLIETIQAQWWITVERSRIRENFNTKVVIEFTLRKDGTIHDAVVVESSATNAGTYACKDAIESRAPFDPWREDMVAAVGDEERGRFTFYYR